MSTQYSGFFNCVLTVAREEGPLALYRGLLPRLMRIPPGQAITWAVADQIIGLYEGAVRQGTEAPTKGA